MNRYVPSFSLFQDDQTDKVLWCGSLKVDWHHRHEDVRLVYDSNHPYEKITVFVFREQLPCVNNHIHADGSICYIGENEWNPEWTAYAVYVTTKRFLEDFWSGRMR